MGIRFCGFHTRNADRDRIYRPNGLEGYLFLVILSRMHFEYGDGRKETAEPGACMLYTPGVYQNYYAEAEFFNSFVEFTFDRDKIERLALPCNRIFYPEHYEVYNQQIKKIHQEYLGREAYREEMMESYLEQLLFLIGRSMQADGEENEIPMEVYQEFDSVRRMMLWKCQDNWTVEKLCQAVNFEKSRFYQLYQKFFNSTPKEDLIQARLQLALYHMTNKSITIQTAAFQAGFGNINYFNRLFQKRFGCTPSEYRKKEILPLDARVHKTGRP